jgi:predicted alpha/beta superfamily hydrolase
VLPPNEAGRHYQLHVGLPASYGKEPSRRYPVVYVTDGYWDFAKLTTIHSSLVYDQVVPEYITVGIGYAGESPDYGQLRRWELTPVPFGDDGKASGHASDFLKTIETVVIPFVEKEYRADPSHRVLGGASLGGLFTLYAMYTNPTLFEAYIAVTPAVVVGNDWLLGYEEAFAKSGRPLTVRLPVSGGGNESPGFLAGILRFNQRITSRKHERLAYEFRDRGECIFAGDDFYPSPLYAYDGDQAVLALLGFLALQPGDTDQAHFAKYSNRQLAWAYARATALRRAAETLEVAP